MRLALALFLFSFVASADCGSQSTTLQKSVTVRHLTLLNLTQISARDHQRIVQDIKSREYRAGWKDEIPERIRYALQDRGYFRAAVGEPESKVVWETPAKMVVDMSLPVDAGSLYRLDSIAFEGGNVFAPEQLHAQFPISPREIFAVEKIRKGLENLRKLYADNGFINFAPVPDSRVLDGTKSVRLVITLDEGGKFYFGDLKVAGIWDAAAARTLLEDWASLKGNLYSQRALEEFMKQRKNLLPPGFRPEFNCSILQDANSHTVSIELVSEWNPP